MRRRGRLAHIGAKRRERRAARLVRRNRTVPRAGLGGRIGRTRSPRGLQRPAVPDDPSRFGALRGGGRVARPEIRVVDGEGLLASSRKQQRQKRRGDEYAPPQAPGFEHGSSPKRRAEKNLPRDATTPPPHGARATKYLTSVHNSYRVRHILPSSLMGSPVAAVPDRASGSRGYTPVRGLWIDRIEFGNRVHSSPGFEILTEDGAVVLRSLTTGPDWKCS